MNTKHKKVIMQMYNKIQLKTTQ